MDITVIKTKHMNLYLSTLQIGLGISYVPEHKSLYIQLGVFEFEFMFLGKRDYCNG